MTPLERQGQAFSIRNHSTSDYIAARCLILNYAFSQGYALAAQAVEKLLKAHYRIRGGDRSFRDLGHNIQKIKVELLDYGLDVSQFNDIFDLLENAYKVRYPPSPKDKGPWGSCYTNQSLEDLDRLMFHLTETYPDNEEDRYLNGCYGVISQHLWASDQPLPPGIPEYISPLGREYSLLTKWNKPYTENKKMIHEGCLLSIRKCWSGEQTA